jgi:hypothetical protein
MIVLPAGQNRRVIAGRRRPGARPRRPAAPPAIRLACEAALIPAASAADAEHSFIVTVMKPAVYVPRYQVLPWILSAGDLPLPDRPAKAKVREARIQQANRIASGNTSILGGSARECRVGYVSWAPASLKVIVRR